MKKKYEHKEEDVAKALGLTREYIAELRQANLMVDEDVAVVSGCIRYSDAGIRKLTDILGLQQKTAADSAEAARLSTEVLKTMERQETAVGSASGAGAPAIPDSEKNALAGTLDAVVTRIYGHNRQYMEATLGDQAIVIRVRNNEHFVLGMIVESRWLTRVNERVFDFVGRCPRGRGKW